MLPSRLPSITACWKMPAGSKNSPGCRITPVIVPPTSRIVASKLFGG
jgi:hypothetical protein